LFWVKFDVQNNPFFFSPISAKTHHTIKPAKIVQERFVKKTNKHHKQKQKQKKNIVLRSLFFLFLFLFRFDFDLQHDEMNTSFFK